MIPATGHRIYQLRLEKKITQSELAKLAEIPQPNLSNIEQGRQDLTVSTLLKICAALQMKPADFFSETFVPEKSVLNRSRVEKIADAIAQEQYQGLKEEEIEWAKLLRRILPAEKRRRTPEREIRSAWHTLQRKLSKEDIQFLAERVEDAKMRLKARREEEYGELVKNLKHILGR